MSKFEIVILIQTKEYSCKWNKLHVGRLFWKFSNWRTNNKQIKNSEDKNTRKNPESVQNKSLKITQTPPSNLPRDMEPLPWR